MRSRLRRSLCKPPDFRPACSLCSPTETAGEILPDNHPRRIEHHAGEFTAGCSDSCDPADTRGAEHAADLIEQVVATGRPVAIGKLTMKPN